MISQTLLLFGERVFTGVIFCKMSKFHVTSLGKHIQGYTFFGYQSNEALHLSKRERKIVLDCFSKIEYELERAIDLHSKKLTISNIELFLNYRVRFRDRQFIPVIIQIKEF